MHSHSQVFALPPETRARALAVLRRILSQVKIIDVITYNFGLARDLLNPSRLLSDPTDHVRRLFAIVWPSYVVPLTCCMLPQRSLVIVTCVASRVQHPVWRVLLSGRCLLQRC